MFHGCYDALDSGIDYIENLFFFLAQIHYNGKQHGINIGRF